MAEIFDLMELEVNIPSRDFGTYATHLSAPPKFGKSTWCTYFEKPLIFDFEQGTAGKVVYRIPVSKWGEVKKYIKQLTKEPKLKEKYKTICFDTTNYMLEACKQYVMEDYQSRNLDKQIDTFNKIPWGGGWELLGKEFKGEVNKLKRAGYGVVFISHIKDKVFDKETESEHTKTVADLSDKERNMVNAMSDFLLLGEFERELIEPAVKDNSGKVVKEAIVKTNRVLYLRTNEDAEAGFRWEDCPEKISFDFELFIEVFHEAVEKEIAKGKAKFNLSEDKVEEIREKLDEIKESDAEEIFEEEQKADNLEKLQEEIKALLSELKEKGTSQKTIKEKLVSEVNISNPLKITDIEVAKKVVELLKSF